MRAFAEQLRPDLTAAETDDPAHVRLATDDETLAFVITLDALNFGSGWFPSLRKPAGRSGYFTIATALRSHFEAHGSWSAERLEALTRADCTRVFGQAPTNAPVAELMTLFARSLSDLGRALRKRGGGFATFVASANGSAEALVEILAEMPLYRDVATYVADSGPAGLQVPFYKRAQITVADLALAFGRAGPGRFDDIDDLTMFADNLVPHVLRFEGVLEYEESLERRIDDAELLAPGSAEEVEIRAVGLHAVERMARQLGVSDPVLDRVLWQRGQSPRIKSRNRHRTRSVFY